MILNEEAKNTPHKKDYEPTKETKNSPSKILQNDTNNMKDHWKNQLDFTEKDCREPYRNSLEDSLWAPKEDTCREKGEYTAKIASIALPGETSEERIKFVRGTLYRSKHISLIEEHFIKGNLWVVISFDCLKGVEILKERLRKKSNEWYNILFEEQGEQRTQQKDTTNKVDRSIRKSKATETIKNQQNKEKLAEEEKSILSSKERNMGSNSRHKSKGKGKDFLWLTLWDLPLGYSKLEIERLLKPFGRIEEIQTQNQTYYQVAEIKLHLKNEEQEERLKANWSIGLESGRLTHLTVGLQNK